MFLERQILYHPTISDIHTYSPSSSINHTLFQSLINSRTKCYDLSYVLSKRYTLVLSNTRELNRVPKYKCLPYIQTTDGPCYIPLALP